MKMTNEMKLQSQSCTSESVQEGERLRRKGVMEEICFKPANTQSFTVLTCL